MKGLYLRSARAFLLCFALASSVPGSAESPTSDPAISLLKQVKAAMGGAKWDSVTVIDGEGRKTSFGLNGSFYTRVELATGFFERRAQYDMLSNAEGLDKMGRWRQDNSGQVHPLDSQEAVTVAESESYLSRFGYLFPQRSAAQFSLCTHGKGSDKGFDSVVVTPEGGRAFTLWINAATHLPDHAVMELSVGSETIRFAVYRTVDGILLPFRTSIEHGDESETGTASLAFYQILTVPPKRGLVRPQASTRDAMLRFGAEATSANAFLDEQTGWFIVQAKVNGQGPYPFILDTGGHDILVPAMAKQLGLSRSGEGASNGAGAGSTPIEFTTVESLSLGQADMVHQPFTILHVDLGTAGRGKAARLPIAGILGLELFERFVVTMDYRDNLITLRPSAEFKHQGAGIPVPIHFTSDMPIASATLDGHPGQFDIDTGNNTDLIVFPTWALGSGVANLKVSPGEMKGTSIGGTLALAHLQSRAFEIAGVGIDGVNLLLSSDKAGSLSARAEAGNAGNSIWSHFREVTFDYRSEQMYLDR